MTSHRSIPEISYMSSKAGWWPNKVFSTVTISRLSLPFNQSGDGVWGIPRDGRGAEADRGVPLREESLPVDTLIEEEKVLRSLARM
jgi:hypothetical protein